MVYANEYWLVSQMSIFEMGCANMFQLYRQYANIPFFDLFQYELKQRSVSSILLTGLPAFALNHALKQISFSFGICQKNVL